VLIVIAALHLWDKIPVPATRPQIATVKTIVTVVVVFLTLLWLLCVAIVNRPTFEVYGPHPLSETLDHGRR
jgi:hypothetical protein